MKTPNKTCLHFVMLPTLVLALVAFKPVITRYEAGTQTVSWAVLPNSFITINGSSNVNTFGCEAIGLFQAETIQGTVEGNGKNVKMKGSISLDINQFDCKNRMLTSDLRKTLKAEEYPKMSIHFVSLERLPLCNGGEDFISGMVVIELAGKRKPFQLRYSFAKTPQGYKLEGSRAFSFADFDLSPPKKVGGLVKVKDDFDVAFTLQLSDAN